MADNRCGAHAYALVEAHEGVLDGEEHALGAHGLAQVGRLLVGLGQLCDNRERRILLGKLGVDLLDRRAEDSAVTQQPARHAPVLGALAAEHKAHAGRVQGPRHLQRRRLLGSQLAQVIHKVGAHVGFGSSSGAHKDLTVGVLLVALQQGVADVPQRDVFCLLRLEVVCEASSRGAEGVECACRDRDGVGL